MERANFLGAPQFFNLNHACLILNEAFGPCTYLVGSCLVTRDFRDVDVRTILDDTAYDRMFPGITVTAQYHPLWSLVCAAIAEWLRARTGLPIDFQIQQQSKANEQYDGPRHALGVFFHSPQLTKEHIP